MMEGAGSSLVTNGSGSGRPKNILIYNYGSRKNLGAGNVAKKEDFDLKSSRKEANFFLTFYAQLYSTWLSCVGPCCEL